jgi:hypothetical protein
MPSGRSSHNGNATIRRPVTLHLRVYQEIVSQAASEGVSFSEFMVRGAHMALRRGDTTAFREVVMTPKGESTVDALMEWLFARRPVLADIAPTGQELPVELRRAMAKVLTPRQMGRLEHVILCGGTLESIGRQEGCSKQAIDASIRRALTRLGQSREFVEALCRAFPDSGLDAKTLMRAAEARNAEKAARNGQSAAGSASGAPRGGLAVAR